MKHVDWRELYASNQAAIARAGGIPSELPAPLRGVPARRGAAAPQAPPLPHRRLRFLVHTPRGAEPQTAIPLVCMLHGCTQDAAGLAAVTRMNEAADRHGFAVLYPQQDREQNPQCCWNWFLPEHQSRGAGEPAAIVNTVREVIGTVSPWTIDRRRVFVAGLSAGGAMATILAATYPDLFAAVAVHSGIAYGAATNVGAAFAAMARGTDQVALGDAVHAAMGVHARAVPTIVIHGTADQTVAPRNADQVLGQAIAGNRLAAPQTCGELDITRPSTTSRGSGDGDGHPYLRARWTDSRGALMHELLTVEGLGHAWSGGAPGHPYSDPRGPSAAEAIWRFFRQATSAAGEDGAALG
jgi:poly(hydroxyalkanoate) depolymerase family esterase